MPPNNIRARRMRMKTIVFIGLSASLLIHYCVMTVIALSVYLLQIVSTTGSLAVSLSLEGLSDYERYMLSWVQQGFCKAAGLVFFFGVALFVLVNSRFHRHSRTQFYFGYLAFCSTVLLLSYYSWALDGMCNYYFEIRHQGTTLTELKRGMLVISILNLIDISRTLILSLLALITHFYCQRRARHHMMGRPLLAEERVRRDPVLRDLEDFYRE